MATKRPAKKVTKGSGTHAKPPKPPKGGGGGGGGGPRNEPLFVSSGTGGPDSTLAQLAASPYTYGLALFIDISGANAATLAKIEQFVSDLSAVTIAVGKTPKKP